MEAGYSQLPSYMLALKIPFLRDSAHMLTLRTSCLEKQNRPENYSEQKKGLAFYKYGLRGFKFTRVQKY